jgi:transcription antitermination factor NusB
MAQDERSQARTLALQALCLLDGGGGARADDIEGFLRDSINHADLGWRKRPAPRLLRRAAELTRGAWAFHPRADELLTKHVTNWSVRRMSPVDRNLLRLGLFELLEQPDTPPAVVINEAVALAQQFGGNESAAFVNGVLDHLRKALDAWATEAAPPVDAHPPTPESES